MGDIDPRKVEQRMAYAGASIAARRAQASTELTFQPAELKDAVLLQLKALAIHDKLLHPEEQIPTDEELTRKAGKLCTWLTKRSPTRNRILSHFGIHFVDDTGAAKVATAVAVAADRRAGASDRLDEKLRLRIWARADDLMRGAS